VLVKMGVCFCVSVSVSVSMSMVHRGACGGGGLRLGGVRGSGKKNVQHHLDELLKI